MMKLTLFALCLVIFRVEAATEMVGVESLETQLTKHLSADTEVLSFETDAEKFYALQNLAYAPEPAGGILILTDPRADTDWITQSHSLRQVLPEQGWTVVTLEATNELTEEQRLNRAKTLLGEIERLEIDRLVVIAFGESASTALTLAADTEDLRLVMLDAILPAAPRSDISAIMEELEEISVIDMTHHTHPLDKRVLEDARLRRLIAKQLALPNYVSRTINTTFTNWSTSQISLAKSIAGALKTHIIEAERMEMAPLEPEQNDAPN